MISVNRGQRVRTLVANQSTALHKNIAKSFGFMDFLNSRIYEYLKSIPSKTKQLSWVGKRVNDIVTQLASCLRRKAAPFYPRQSCDLHIPRHTSSDGHNGLLLPSVAVFRAPPTHPGRVRAAQKAAAMLSEPEKSPGSNPDCSGGTAH